MKKDGGSVTKWTFHNLNFTPEEMEKAFPGGNAMPLMFTAIVVKDPTGRWPEGFHMRSSCVVSFDKFTGVIETLNTMYKLEGQPGDPYFPDDLGNGVLGIHY